MSRVILDRVSKRFDSFVAVDGLSLEVRQGELVSLLGPSGCGKTTTLRMVAGLEHPSSGAILFDGVPVHHLPPQRRGVGLVFQNYALFWHMTVYDNIAFGLRIRNVPASRVDQEVHRFAEMLELTDILHRRSSGLDLSSMQRVALARTLITQPQVLLLDEPFNNIRPGLREAMRTELRRLQQELGQTTIFVTHDQEEALTLSDRVVVMRQGRVEQAGTPDVVYQRPANLFVAAFLGAPGMNLLRCRVEEGPDGPVLASPGLRVRAPDWSRPLIGAGREVWLGIRPEAVRVGHGELVGAVTMVQPLGAEVLVTIDPDPGSGRSKDSTLQALVAPARRMRRGDAVTFSLPHEHLRLFDVQSGEALHGQR
ncbi:MAG: ABC transporter ATP-binding protein [Bacillota bacterium]